MEQMFSGDWIVDFPSATQDGSLIYDKFYNEHRFTIVGSTTNSGPHPQSANSVPVSVSGPSWYINLEWFHRVHGWLPNPVPLRRIRAGYTLQSGLVVLLQADNNTSNKTIINDAIIAGGGMPFSTLALSCRNIDPKLTPWAPFVNLYDFTMPQPREPREPREPRKPSKPVRPHKPQRPPNW